MKKLKKQGKKAATKGIHAFGIMLMVLQSVSVPLTSGALFVPTAAIAEDAGVKPDSSDVSSKDDSFDLASEKNEKDDAKKDETAKDEKTGTADKEDLKSDSALKTDAKPETSLSDDSASTSKSNDDTAAVKEDTLTSATTSTNATDITDSTTNGDSADNGLIEETSGTIDPEAAYTDKAYEPAETPEKTPVSDDAPIAKKECLADGVSIKSSDASDWKASGDSAETKNPVKLGIKYQFPLDKEVSVTFTCLPADPAKLSALKIERIKTTDIDFPKGIYPATEYAYDLTTGMKDGDFKYDFTLPGDKKAKDIYYIEKTANEVKNSEISKSDLNKFDKKDVDINKDKVEVENVDHFTVMVVTGAVLNIVLNEVYPNASGGGSENNEFIEIYNLESTSVTLDNWSIDDDTDGSSYSLNGKTISAGGFLSFKRQDTGVALTNSGDTARLIYSGQVIDSKGWTSDPGESTSFGRCPDGTGSWTNLSSQTSGSANDCSGGSGGSGAIWTTDSSCGDEQQDVNHYNRGEHVYINGSGFSPNTQYSWNIIGQPGGASCDPGNVVAFEDHRATDSNGDFCFDAYTVATDDCGEYKVNFGNKNDNYRIDGICGDSYVDSNETCDDGSDNGSNGNCNVSCTGMSLYCGDGIINGSETCDGGSQSCSANSGYLGTQNCLNTCDGWGNCISGEYCGDAIKNGSEQCDDGNSVDNDICSNACQNVVLPICGDGIMNGDEQCDDGNSIPGDGCNGLCQTEAAEICGNGLDDEGDGFIDCDDVDCANDSNCQGPVCGNGTIETGEECDINSLPQACTTQDGYQGEITCGEICLWNTYCYPKEGCGDGIVNGNEQCDDGNSVDNDSCSNACQNVVLPICGDGTVQDSEQCDDGNIISGDGCSTTCQTEREGSISGKKFEDCDADGIFEPGCETGMRGWTIFIDSNGNGTFDAGETSLITNGQGNYTFSDLLPGTYRICEIQVSGWIQTMPGEGQCHDIILNGEDLTDKNFGNFKLGYVQGRKFNDLNGNGWQNYGESFLNDWTIRLYNSDWEKIDEKTTSGSGGETGKYSFDNLEYGTYYICEAMPSGWQQTAPSGGWGVADNMSGATDEGAKCYRIEIDCSGEIFNGKIFGNQEAAPYCGDGIVNQDSEQCDDGNTINGDGCSASCQTETTGKGNLTICKYNDLNKNGLIEDGEPKIWWQMTVVDKDGLDMGETWNTATPAENCLTLNNMDLGEYEITESVSADWTRSFPIDSDSQTAVLSVENPDATVNFLNYESPSGTVTVLKYSDDNENGIWDDGEAALPDWDIVLDNITSGSGMTLKTDANGQSIFENLFAGEYKLSENIQTGWEQTNISCEFQGDEQRVALFESESAIDSDNDYPLTLASGDRVYCEIGNHPSLPPVLTIEKFNDQWPNLQSPGAIVDYTITIRAYQNSLRNVVVKDLMPNGFSFNSITSVVKNGTTNLSVPDPAYHSPGTWQLGDMEDGDEVVIKFKANVGSSQQAGTYKDNAWAQGEDGDGGQVLASSVAASTVDPGNINTNFVGTKIALAGSGSSRRVALDEDEDTETETKTKERIVGRVLGVSTGLPATGSNTLWIILAIIVFLFGSGLILLGRKKKNSQSLNSSGNVAMKILILALLAASIIALPGKSAFAAANVLNIRLEQPDTPTGSGNLNIGFVVLDITGGRNITVECWKKGPSDAAFSVFSTVSVQAGGNSGTCDVVFNTDGVYEIYAGASAGSDSADSQVEPVTVNLDSQAPGTPLNYDRSGDSCNITFTTANDGITSEVELYRSKDREFAADASTFSTQVSIGPNTNGSLSDPLGNCDDYLYAIRAVSASGVGSDFVGDEDVVVHHRTETNTRTITRTTTVSTSQGGAISTTEGGTIAGEQAGEGAGEGEVAGEKTGEGNIGEGEEGEVAGAASLMSKVKNNWPWIGGAAAVLAYIYYAMRKRKKGLKNNDTPDVPDQPVE